MKPTSRRDFLKRASVAPLAAGLPSAMHAAAAAAGPMKITRIEAVTFRKGITVGGGPGGREDAEWFWVRLHTDSGLVGTGETYPYSNAEIGALKDYSSQLLGRDPRDIDGIWRSYYKAMSMRNAGGADMRTLSAINMAQLDILGQASGLPLYRLLGGRTRSQVRVYNTTTNYWSMDNLRMGPDTLKIAAFLFDRGVTAMKIYPFNGRGQLPLQPGSRNRYALDQRHPRQVRRRRWTSASIAGEVSISPAPSASPGRSSRTTSCTWKTPC